MARHPRSAAPPPAPGATAIFFDGTSNRRRVVVPKLSDALEIRKNGERLARWAYADIRRADSPAGVLRLSCLTAPGAGAARNPRRQACCQGRHALPAARREPAGPQGRRRIVGWSLAAAVSIVLVVLFGVPLAADRLTPLVPDTFERRLGDVAEAQVGVIFSDKRCDNAAGQAAFEKLVGALRQSAGLDQSVQSGVLATPIPNAFALPGGKVFLFDGLLAKAESRGRGRRRAGARARPSPPSRQHARADPQWRHLVPDRAAVRRHHRLRRADLRLALAGDVVLFARCREPMPTVCDRDHAPARPPRQADGRADGSRHRQGRREGLSIVSSHPLSEDRLARLGKADASNNTSSGPPLLSAAEWRR